VTLPVIVAGGFAFLAVALGVAAAGRLLDTRLSADRRKVLGRLRALGDGPGLPADDRPAAGSWHRIVAWLGEQVAADTKDHRTKLKKELEYAGFAHPSASQYYLGARLSLLAGLMLAAALVAGLGLRLGWRPGAMWAAAGGLLGYVLPSIYLRNRVARRQQAIRGALPDALDVLVMCVESGASVPAALDLIADEFVTVHPILGHQLQVVRHEMQLGATAGQAVAAFADRCGVDAVRDLAGVLAQAEQYGTGVAKALRTHSEAARVERQLWCEGMAAKAAVKIMFPTLLCIFPAMFIVLLGPAAFQMSKMFSR
jgi:tight adherence protein C